MIVSVTKTHTNRGEKVRSESHRIVRGRDCITMPMSRNGETSGVLQEKAQTRATGILSSTEVSGGVMKLLYILCCKMISRETTE